MRAMIEESYQAVPEINKQVRTPEVSREAIS
jgi:hypothetical protein